MLLNLNYIILLDKLSQVFKINLFLLYILYSNTLSIFIRKFLLTNLRNLLTNNPITKLLNFLLEMYKKSFLNNLVIANYKTQSECGPLGSLFLYSLERIGEKSVCLDSKVVRSNPNFVVLQIEDTIHLEPGVCLT